GTAHHGYLFDDVRPPHAVDGFFEPIWMNQPRQRPRRLGDGADPPCAQPRRDEPGHARLSTRPVDVDPNPKAPQVAPMEATLDHTQPEQQGSRPGDECEAERIHGRLRPRCLSYSPRRSNCSMWYSFRGTRRIRRITLAS